MKTISYIKMIFVFWLLVCGYAYAGWVGPEEVLSGVWGEAVDDFGVDWGDTPTDASYPVLTDISVSGRIGISDVVNHRAKIYQSDGSLLYNLIPPVEDPSAWYFPPHFVDDNVVISINDDYFYSAAGKLVNKVPPEPGNVDYIVGKDGYYFIGFEDKSKGYLKYSPTGELVGRYSERPLELGRFHRKMIRYQGKKYERVTIGYPGGVRVVPSEGAGCSDNQYYRDMDGHLYCGDPYDSYTRYSLCGVKIATLLLPRNKVSVTATAPEGSGIEDSYEVVEDYSNLTIAPDGSVYASHITQKGYSVVKWKWVDSPDDPIGGPYAPTEIKASFIDSKVQLAWRSSLHDPGCVTGYEIERAIDNSTTYSVIDTVKSGLREYVDSNVDSGHTYYYRIRALSAIANSPDSTSVAVSVP